MIASSISGGAICLRCRLRLLRQSTRPFQASNRSHILKVGQPSLRYFADESIDRFGAELAKAYHDGPNDDSKNKTQDAKPPAGGRHVLRKKGLKKLLAGGRLLTEGVEGLDMGIMGKPGQVIVMKDHGLLQRTSRMPEYEDTEGGQANQGFVDIEALLDNQQQPPTAREVRDNIDGLRPSTDTVLSGKEFRNIQNQLADGFLSIQLIAYLEHVTNKPLSKDSWIKNISPWAPLGDQQSIPIEVGPSQFGYTTDTDTAKSKLALRIMRECWGLSMAELNGGLGETHIKIRNYEFLLIMRHIRHGAHAMGNVQLDRGEKIEAVRKQNTIRIVSTKTKAPVWVKTLRETLRQIETRSFPLRMVTSDPIDHEVLEEVGRITNTHIRYSSTTNRLHVTWIETKSSQDGDSAGLEDPREAVFRLLLTAYNRRPVKSHLYITGLADNRHSRFIIDTTNKEKLEWTDRMVHWARLSLPVTAEKDTAIKLSSLRRLPLPVQPQKGLLPDKVPSSEKPKEFVQETRFPVYPVTWSQGLETRTTACFGHLLHRYNPAHPPPPMPMLGMVNHPRIFAPVAPHPFQLAKFETSNRSVPMHAKRSILIRFWPTRPLDAGPTQQTRPKGKKKEKVENAIVQGAPVLEVRLAVQGGQVKGVESVHALREMQYSDVMLPTSPVDLRYAQTRYHNLEGDLAELAAWQPVADFLKPARLDLASGRLEVPAHQRFPIPVRLFDEDYPMPERTGVLGPHYTVAGVEVHRSVSTPHEGCLLTYTSIDAGLGGGHRAELTVEPAFSEERPWDEMNVTKYHVMFLATCQKLARTNALWTNHPPIREY
ncbi:mitochondrial inner-membrane-bound regulator-domain-containing protein [Hypoxylon sp. FL1284]|nr:mitochondrial inner-membrane-bound regulator-domain-containing protein [Hypoxylon sp. FL1284]KAI0172378.1 mitochondrial inner-membrane-bound regulator-domain-containing protein [Hypoxylon sp. FL1284]